MAISNPTSVTAAISATSGTVLKSGSFTPSVGANLIIPVQVSAAVTWTLSIAAPASWALTWTQVVTTPEKGNTGVFNGSALLISSAVGSSPASGAASVTCSTAITGAIAEFYSVTGGAGVGATGTTPTPVSGVPTSPFTCTLSAPPAATSLVVGTIGNRIGNAVVFGAPAGWTVFTTQSLNSTNYEMFSYLNGGALQSNQWTDNHANADSIAAAEITSSGGAAVPRGSNLLTLGVG